MALFFYKHCIHNKMNTFLFFLARDSWKVCEAVIGLILA